MKSILLIGLGRFGNHIAAKLNELHHQVMAVDKNEQRINDALPLVTDAQIGDATNKTFLRSLGVDNYDVCFVAIGDDFQSSLIVTSYLKELGAKKVIARASRNVQRQFLLRNGADGVVYPEKQLAAWTAIRYTSDHILDYIALDDEFAIYDVSVPAEWDGKTDPYDPAINHNPVVNNTAGSIVGYKYFNFDGLRAARAKRLLVDLVPQGVKGRIVVKVDDPVSGTRLGVIRLSGRQPQERTQLRACVRRARRLSGKHALFFVFESATPDRSLCELEGFAFR